MSNSNIELIQGLYAAIGRGDIGTIINALSSDVDWRINGRREDYPLLGSWNGQNEVRKFFQALSEYEETVGVLAAGILRLGRSRLRARPLCVENPQNRSYGRERLGACVSRFVGARSSPFVNSRTQRNSPQLFAGRRGHARHCARLSALFTGGVDGLIRRFVAPSEEGSIDSSMRQRAVRLFPRCDASRDVAG
jgi:hypothetical protein